MSQVLAYRNGNNQSGFLSIVKGGNNEQELPKMELIQRYAKYYMTLTTIRCIGTRVYKQK